MARGKPLIGLDIGSSCIKLCQLKQGKRKYELLNFGIAQLPYETIVDGSIINPDVVVERLQQLFAVHKVKDKNVAISVCGHSVIVRKLSLQKMSPQKLQEVIQWEAEQYIPFDIKEVFLDVEILSQGEGKNAQMEVLLVAARKETINEYVQVVKTAGLVPKIVDIDCFALQNQFEVNYEWIPEEMVVLLDIGANTTSLNILHNGTTAFTRDISPLGGALYNDKIREELGVTFEQAEILKMGGYEEDQSSIVPRKTEQVIQNYSQKVCAEIQRSLDFFSATHKGFQFSKIYVAGGTSKIPSLASILARKTGISVEVINPFRNIEVDPKRFDLNYLNEFSPLGAVSVGLALRTG